MTSEEKVVLLKEIDTTYPLIDAITTVIQDRYPRLEEEWTNHLGSICCLPNRRWKLYSVDDCTLWGEVQNQLKKDLGIED